MSDLVDDHIEVFCGGRCLEFLHTQHGGHSIREKSMNGGHRGSNPKHKHQRDLTYVIPVIKLHRLI